MKSFIETTDIVSGFLPVDMQTAANTGDSVSLKDYSGCIVLLFKNAGTAGDDPTITLLQGTDVAFGTNKALNFTTIYTKQDTVLTGVTSWTKVTQTAANTYTDATSAEDAAIWAIPIDAAELDTDGGYDCLRASVADTGTNAQLGCLLYIMIGARYPQETPLDSITD